MRRHDTEQSATGARNSFRFDRRKPAASRDSQSSEQPPLPPAWPHTRRKKRSSSRRAAACASLRSLWLRNRQPGARLCRNNNFTDVASAVSAEKRNNFTGRMGSPLNLMRRSAPARWDITLLLCALALLTACSSRTSQSPKANASYTSIAAWRNIEDLPRAIAQFETVFWEPADTDSLRLLIRSTGLVKNRTVMEIGTGTGLISLCCAQYGAKQIVATDINSNAVTCANFNAAWLNLNRRIETRLVSEDKSGAFQVIGDNERFDFIISNPPWVEQKVRNLAEYALYDPGWHLLTTLMDGLPAHLNPGGRCLLAYGSVSGVKAVIRESQKRGFKCIIKDDRNLDDLEEEFLPGMLLEVIVPPDRIQATLLSAPAP